MGSRGKEIPWNLFSPKAPYTGKVVENNKHPQTLTEDTGDANWETTHVTFDHGGNVPYIEGQSIGVIAPGPDKKGETPAKIRLYSIASSAVGDDQTSKTVSLCVKRVVELDGKHVNREKGDDKPDKAGAAADGSRKFKGLAWLFMGVPYSKSLLYDDEHTVYKKEYPDQFRFDYAVSREDKNAAGQKMYIQTKMAEYAEELWDLMQSPKTHIYMCGLKGMESGMEECFGPIAEKAGLDWKEFAKGMKKSHRYHVEVY